MKHKHHRDQKSSFNKSPRFRIILLPVITSIFLITVVLVILRLSETKLFASDDPGWKTDTDMVKSQNLSALTKIIEVDISYSTKQTNLLTIKQTVIKNSRMGKESRYPGSYTLAGYNSQDKQIVKTTFNPPDTTFGYLPTTGSKLSSNIYKNDNFNFIVSLPYDKKIVLIKILNSDGKIISKTTSVRSIFPINKPKFQSITGEKVIQSKKDRCYRYYYLSSILHMPQA
jgi:hypothetical protein